MIEVFSSGGGTQSAAISALIIQGKLPRPDYVVIVDTERERATTWEYLDNVIRPAFDSIGMQVHRVRRAEWGSYPAHGNDLLSHNGNTLLIPAWTTQTEGQVGKLSGFCSKTWKSEVCDRYLSKKFGITRSQYRKWIGFSMDEPRRFLRMMRGEEFRKGLLRIPLVHDYPLRRAQSIELVKSMGWAEPPRSACYICGNMGDAEWISLPPDEFEMACQTDDSLRDIDPHAFLHHSGKPLREVDFTQATKQGDFCASGGMLSVILPANILNKMSAADRKALGKAGLTASECEEIAEAKTEKHLQNQLYSLLYRRGHLPTMQRMDRKSNIAVGMPDISFSFHGRAVYWEVKMPGKNLESIQGTTMSILAGWPNFAQVRVIRSYREGLDHLTELATTFKIETL